MRKCTLCDKDELVDEYHCVLICKAYTELHTPRYFYEIEYVQIC